MYVLPLPTEWAMQHVYQGDQSSQRGMYEASRLFLQTLHARGHAVSRPEQAGTRAPLPYLALRVAMLIICDCQELC